MDVGMATRLWWLSVVRFGVERSERLEWRIVEVQSALSWLFLGRYSGGARWALNGVLFQSYTSQVSKGGTLGSNVS